MHFAVNNDIVSKHSFEKAQICICPPESETDLDEGCEGVSRQVA